MDISIKSQAKEKSFQNDSRFRKYVQLVEKNLQSFDAVYEWADIISFLGRLLKSFQAYPQFPVIPRKQLVAKRLAQCLNPGFPAGVHQKTLEVYSFILKTIGEDQLADDLAIWSTGLFPFVQHAATHVKPQLLTIFETYYFPLKGRLRSAIRGFIIALAPALEEEGSEYFDRVVELIEKLSDTVELPFFNSCIWLAMISNPSLRPPLLNYLLRKLPKISDKEDVAVVLGGKENVSLMIRAFSATLNDQQLLVQRGMLELLVQNFILKHRMIPHNDLVALMKSAVGIVLRKDMSLNRRLFAWLLSTESSAQAQMVYFNTFAEKAATQAVRGMLHEEQANLQRPYKILISLMDKPEVGQPIVNSIFMDSLVSLKKTQSNAEVMQSANMWMDMMEPYLICMKLFECLDTNFPLNKSSPQALEKLKVIEFALTSFKLTDDEIYHVQFPLLLAVMSKKIQTSLKSPTFIDSLSHVDRCISLLLLLLDQLPEHVLLKEHPAGDGRHYDTGTNIVDYAREFYGYQQQKTAERTQKEETQEAVNEDEGDLSNVNMKEPIQCQLQKRPNFEPIRGSVLVKEVAENMIRFLVEFIDKYIVLPEDPLDGIDVGAEGKDLKHIEHHLERVLSNACKVIHVLSKYADDTFETSQALTKALLDCSQQVHVFGLFSASLSTLVQLIKQKRFVDLNVLRSLTHVKKVMDKLWGFLSPATQLLHMRTVELVWLLIDVSAPHQVETIVSNFLIQQESIDNFDKFGILWVLSESIPQASQTFSRPMGLVLDLLGGSPIKKRIGERWVRSYLTSHVRILEPFILTLTNKKIIQRRTTKQVAWDQQTLKNKQPKTTEIVYYLYAKPFDAEVVDYLFSSLYQLFRFGGSNVLKSCKSHFVDTEGSMSDAICGFLTKVDEREGLLTFLDILVLVSIRYLESEYEGDGVSQAVIRSIQLHAIDFLYLVMTELEPVEIGMLKRIQISCLHKLLYCISVENFDLQYRLLQLLHSTLALTSEQAHEARKHQRQASTGSEVTKSEGETNEAILLIQTSSDLFVKIVIDALTLPSHRPMLIHWSDFVSAALPSLKHGFQHIMVPILICLCHQIYARCGLLQAAVHEIPDLGAPVESTEKEILILLHSFEQMVMFCLTEKHLSDSWFLHRQLEMPIPLLPEKSSGLSGFAQFVHENQKHEKPRDVILYHLPVMLHIVLDLWRVFRKPQWSALTLQSLGDARAEAILHTFSCAADHVKGKLETIFEKLFRYSAVDVTEAFTEIFFIENPLALELEQQQMDEKAFDYLPLDVLSVTPSSTPEYIVSILLDSIRQRTPGTYQNRRRHILRFGKLTDTSLLRFAEIYCGYMKKPESMVILWPIIHSFAKDYLSQASTFKAFLPGLMRFLTVALEELSLSEGYEKDRRIRRDAQDLYQRCVDYCILIAGKALDQSLWIRRPTTVYEESATDDASSVHTADSLLNEEKNLSTSNVSDLEKKASWKTREDSLINQINQYLANHVIPRLRQLVGDNDKINSLLNNLVYYVIVPSMKSKSRSMVILNQLCEMAYMPFTYKTWRKEVWDMFIDPRFFYMTPLAAKKWKTVIQTAFSIEKERFGELMSRTTISPSTTFFSNKDQEILNGAMNLRRLSFVLFAGSVDQYVPQLPVIQEKIVELLKLEHGEMVHIEIYLCLRIMLVRFSQKHLMNFWPVLITELMRLFNSFVYNDFDYRPEEAQMALAGCKFLDLLCTLELDSFQIYQWIFIRDTVDTVIKRSETGPMPILELLDEKMMALPNPMDISAISLMETTTPSSGSLRRPMLTMHSIGSLHQLSFFIEHVGLYVYQSSFTLAQPDLPFIESLLLTDLLEGDVDTTVEN